MVFGDIGDHGRSVGARFVAMDVYLHLHDAGCRVAIVAFRGLASALIWLHQYSDDSLPLVSRIHTDLYSRHSLSSRSTIVGQVDDCVVTHHHILGLPLCCSATSVLVQCSNSVIVLLTTDTANSGSNGARCKRLSPNKGMQTSVRSPEFGRCFCYLLTLPDPRRL